MTRLNAHSPRAAGLKVQPLRRITLTCVFGCCLLSFAGLQGTAASTPSPQQSQAVADEKEVRPLELGKPIERELAGGQQHAYQLTLAAGQYLRVVVEQRGVDVVVMLLGPDGKTLLEVDSPNGTQGPEPVSWIVETAGRYRLEIRSLEKNAKAGRYEAKLMELRTATANDHAQVEKVLALSEATQLDAEASTLREAGQYDKAVPLAARALAIREKALGAEHPDVATSLNNLALLYDNKGDYAQAEPLHQRALAIYEKVLGADHPDVANSLNNLALLYDNKGDYAQAEPLYQRALAIKEKALGADHPATALSLNNLATLYYRKGDYAKAEPLHQRALAIYEKVLGAEHPATARSLNNLAALYDNKGDYAQAEPLYQRALRIREKALGAEHPDVATSLNNLALLYYDKGDYAKAEPLYQRALAIYEKILGADHPATATILNNLAGLYRAKGDYAQAEPLMKRALAIGEKVLGAEHPDIPLSLNNLANLYKDKGDYEKAEPLYQRALAINEKALGAEHPKTAAVLNNLATLYYRKGDYAKAEPLHQRALAIYEKALGADHPATALSLNDLAALYQDKGDYAKAEPLYQRALAIYEKALGADHPNTATSLNNLALLYDNKGDYAQAEPLFRRALAIREKTLGAEHPDTGNSLSNLAALYSYEGDYAQAEPLFRRALAIHEKTLGAEHPNTAISLNYLASFHEATGNISQAVTLRSRALAIEEHNISINLATGSERQKLAYLTTLARSSNRSVALHVRFAPDNATARDLALTAILQRKGRVLDAMNNGMEALRHRANPQDRALFDQLQDARAQLARLVLGGLQKASPAEYQQAIQRREASVEKLETELGSRSSEFRVQSQPITLEAVQSAVPKDSVLIEIVSFSPFDLKTGKWEKPRYVAYVLFPQGEPRWVDLGEVAPIDQATAEFRKILHGSKSANVKALARRLDEKVMQPIRKLLGPTHNVLLSPDGALNLVPFAALVDEQNRYLVERYSFTYLTSGRDLLRLRSEGQATTAPVIVANPDFGAQPAGQKGHSARGMLDLTQAYFPPLAATAQEATAIKAILPQATVLTQGQATETALKQLASPSLLHIATHGFFLADKPEDAAETERQRKLLQQTGDWSSLGGRLENPLLRSGLGLAGANLRKSGDDDGILTAMEVAGLNLWGTKLVVLSACETGVGEVKTGEGVYGLRRALVLAGAETQVMSLWPVSDRGTRDLMIGYYQSLQAGQGRSEAMRQVQLRMLKDPQRRHPFYWSSFIVSGEWANLNGKR